jgi:hypothetical protein
MNVIDPQAVSILAKVLIAPISLIIASIALRGYIKVRSESSLLLSISFFLLSCLSFLPIVEVLGLFPWPSGNQGFEYIDQTILILNVLSIIQIAAFALLAYVYLKELKNGTIRFSRIQLNILAAAFAFIIFYSLYAFNKYSGNSFGHPVFPFLSAILSVMLMLLIVTLVFSFYRAKGNRSTIIGMVGYLLILSNVAYGLISYDSIVWSMVHNGAGDWAAAMANVLSLTGYVVILVAIIRTRLSHG